MPDLTQMHSRSPDLMSLQGAKDTRYASQTIDIIITDSCFQPLLTDSQCSLIMMNEDREASVMTIFEPG